MLLRRELTPPPFPFYTWSHKMNPTDWAGFVVALISILGSTALGVKWLVKHYLNELKPNGGSSIKDKVSVLEDKVDFLTDLVKQVLQK